MSVICHIDGSEHETVADVHALLKSLRIKQESYYHQYEPRKDRLTGELIPYKDHKQYFSAEFVDKNNVRNWILKNPEEGRIWAIDYLKKRKKEKGLVYAPSQVELRSLPCPSILYYDSIGGYNQICTQLGLKVRYDIVSPTFTAIPRGARVVCDTREQEPLKLSVETVFAKVEEGDYALEGVNDKGIYIERKSLNDFTGTLSGRKIERVKSEDSNLARFDRELERAAGKNHYIVMMIEAPLDRALEFDSLDSMKRVKASPAYIFKNLRDLLVKYPETFQAVFVKNRTEAARVALRIFEMGKQVRGTDLQLAYERKVL